MIGFEIGTRAGEELLRFVRALGQHRYVASRLLLVHAFAVDAAADDSIPEAAEWAKRVINAGADGVIDLASKDERLWRKATEAELAAVLRAFWGPDRAAASRLRAHLSRIDVKVDAAALPFDEGGEDDIFPVLVDAGWELLPLAHLDLDRHRGAIQAFDDFEVARFEEESAIPPLVSLHELPLLGPVELLAPFGPDGRTRAPFVLWQEGNETYLDYVLRGVLKVSKITLDDT
ncbi:MAG: hypothetical protein KIT84_28280 [Labilithrix sp.]|nr:hypothetical protein [Labilithrix sp.]MCW5814957.1 hypothetical protein [Labilithrix sp.]